MTLPRTAILLASWWKVHVEHAGGNLRSHLIGGLDISMDVLLLLLYRSDEACDSEESCGMRNRFRCLAPVTRLWVERQLSINELTTALEASQSWNGLLKGALRGICSATKSRTLPYHCNRMKENGNSFLAPVVGDPRLNVLRQLHMQSRIHQLLVQHEATVRGGIRYETIIWSRLEFVWIRPHVPLASLTPSTCLWVPVEEDYAGINDRHAVMHRSLAAAYLGRWDMIMDGRLFYALPCLRSAMCAQTSERFLAAVLVHHNATICRFPPLAYLACCGSRCYKPQCHRFHWPSPNASGQIMIAGKYPKEVAAAVVHASALSVPNVELSRRHVRFPPKGFFADQLSLGDSLILMLPAGPGAHKWLDATSRIRMVTGGKHGTLTWTLVDLNSSVVRNRTAKPPTQVVWFPAEDRAVPRQCRQ